MKICFDYFQIRVYLNVKKFKVGSLYCGVGGICQGFINSGFKVAWANDFDKHACKTYRHNFSHKLYEGDIWKLDPDTLEKVDVLAGGFPCQPFSIAGYRKGFIDERGNHFFRIIEYIESLNPKVIFLENVKNLTTHDKGKTFKIIKDAIEANGYSFHAKVLNTMHYGNIPHNRERIFIIGFKNNDDGSNIYSDLFDFPSEEKLTNSVEKIIEKKKVDEKFYYREGMYPFDKIVGEINKENTIYQWRRVYVRENKSGVSPTLTANMGTGGHNVPLIYTKHGIRKLTPTECFKLQGFDMGGSYSFPEEVSNTQLYKQSGNSVSVPVIERLSKNIKTVLNNKKVEIKSGQLKLV